MRSWLLLLCLGLGACSDIPPPEVLPRPSAENLSAGITAAIKDAQFTPPIEVTDLLRAPPSSSASWMVCIRGTRPVDPQGWPYVVFFKETYGSSRYSADADGCGGQQYHPYVAPPTPSPSASPSPTPAKRGKFRQ